MFFGDCNNAIPKFLSEGSVREKKAVFCLLDQYTNECKWSTVQALASQRRKRAMKFELFYFLPEAWIQRSIKSTKSPESCAKWQECWGDADWRQLSQMLSHERIAASEARFRSQLGYHHVASYPFSKADGETKRDMFYMIHATDHPRAPALMRSAYHKVVSSKQAEFRLRYEPRELEFPQLDPLENSPVRKGSE